jgi:hypothetical protein
VLRASGSSCGSAAQGMHAEKKDVDVDRGGWEHGVHFYNARCCLAGLVRRRWRRPRGRSRPPAPLERKWCWRGISKSWSSFSRAMAISRHSSRIARYIRQMSETCATTTHPNPDRHPQPRPDRTPRQSTKQEKQRQQSIHLLSVPSRTWFDPSRAVPAVAIRGTRRVRRGSLHLRQHCSPPRSESRCCWRLDLHWDLPGSRKACRASLWGRSALWSKSRVSSSSSPKQ